MQLYLYDISTQTCLQTLDVLAYTDTSITVAGGGTLYPPPSCELSSLEDLSEQLMAAYRKDHPSLADRLQEVESSLLDTSELAIDQEYRLLLLELGVTQDAV